MITRPGNPAWKPRGGFRAWWKQTANGCCLTREGEVTILLQNLETLNLDPRSISEIFISHGHWDHLGGLADLLRLNQ